MSLSTGQPPLMFAPLRMHRIIKKKSICNWYVRRERATSTRGASKKKREGDTEYYQRLRRIGGMFVPHASTFRVSASPIPLLHHQQYHVLVPQSLSSLLSTSTPVSTSSAEKFKNRRDVFLNVYKN
jgi:hypothetical protein